VGVRTPFEVLGGDSLLAARMLGVLASREQKPVPETWLLGERTIESLAAALEAPATGLLVGLQPRGSRPPLYAFPGHEGVLTGLANLSRELGAEQPVWALDLRRIETAELSAMAARCADLLLERDSRGAYRLLGICFGSYVAVKVAEELIQRGHAVEFLALVDALNPRWRRGLDLQTLLWAYLGQLREKLRGHAALLRDRPAADILSHLARRSLAFVRNHGTNLLARLPQPATAAIRHRRMVLRFEPRPLALNAVLFCLPGRRPSAPALGWNGVFASVEHVNLEFDPRGALTARNLPRLAAELARRLG
jgi:thioesterase domain-containing protein